VSVPVAFIVISNMSVWLAPQSVASSGPAEQSNVIDARQQKEPVHRIINSDIVIASVSKDVIKDLYEPVEFIMEHRQVGNKSELNKKKKEEFFLLPAALYSIV
jgi:hypothetical protein